jgi:hypothetical protein
MEDDLTTAKFVRGGPRDNRSLIQDHIDTLAGRLEEAYRVVKENNKVVRERREGMV